MIINNNDLNSMPQQVEENKNNIKLLAQYLKEAYRTNNKAEISQDSISIAISLTNAPTDTTNGWLLDGRGNLFKITGGDGYALLLDFYSDLKGPQGIQGVPGVNGTDGIDGTNGFSLHYSSDDYDENITTYDLSNVSSNTPIVSNDVIIFKNGYILVITSVGDTTYDIDNGSSIQIELVKPKYKHLIKIKSFNDSMNNYLISLVLENEEPNTYNLTTFMDYLNNKGLNSISKYLACNGMAPKNVGSTAYTTIIYGVSYYNDNFFQYNYYNSNDSENLNQVSKANVSFSDTII